MVSAFAIVRDSMLTFLADAAMHEAVPAITSYGVSPIVRVPDFQSWMIKRMSNKT
jgi:2-keto-3-deoxy-L-rhamnonate aldolase RhmA